MQQEIRMMQMETPQMDNKMIVQGRALRFNSPTVLAVINGENYYETIDSRALDNADMTDVIFKYNHKDSSPLLARTRGGSLQLIKDSEGLLVRAEFYDTQFARDIYQLIKAGAIDKMSFAFTVNKNGESFDPTTRTRTITDIKRLFDVSAVDIPAYDDTSIGIRKYMDNTLAIQKLILQTYL